jgi:hypothetical protein
MLDELRKRTSKSTNFLINRYNNPLHTDKLTERQGHLWPSSEEFYHPLNPMFSVFIRTYAHLNYFSVILLRDGALGLMDFFLRFPVPKKTSSIILVHADLSYLVPLAWRPLILCYRMASKNSYHPTGKYFFYGLISDQFLAWNELRTYLPEWLKQFDPTAPVSAFYATRNEVYDHSWFDRRTSMEFTAALQRYFHTPINFITWSQSKSLAANKDVTYINMDLWRHGVGLCQVDYLMMGKVIQVMPRGTYAGFKGEELGSWPLSFQHHLSLYTLEAEHADFEPYVFYKKLSPYVAADMPLPIKTELMQLVRKRTPVSPFAGGAATKSAGATAH